MTENTPFNNVDVLKAKTFTWLKENRFVAGCSDLQEYERAKGHIKLEDPKEYGHVLRHISDYLKV